MAASSATALAVARAGFSRPRPTHCIASRILPVCCGVAAMWFVMTDVALGAETRSADAFVDSIGVNTHTYYDTASYSNYPAWRNKLLGSGIRNIRENLQISSSTQATRVNDLFRAGGIRTSFIFDPRSGGSVRDLLARMKSSLLPATLQVEGPNEYENAHRGDWSSVAAAARAYQEQLYSTVKGDPVTSHLSVLGPAVAFPAGYDSWGDLSGSLDAGNMHPYPGGQMPSANLGRWISAAATTSGPKPVQATETGYHNAVNTTNGHLPASERASGIYLPRTYLGYFGEGVKRTFAYELLNEGTSTSDIEQSFGLLRNDYSDKPAMVALRNLIALLADPGPSFAPRPLDYSLVNAPSDVRQVLLQKRDGTYWLALWREVSVWDQVNRVDLYPPSAAVTVLPAYPLATATSYLPNQSTTPRQIWLAPSSLTINVGPEVTLLELTARLVGTIGGGALAPTSAPGPIPTPSQTPSGTQGPTSTVGQAQRQLRPRRHRRACRHHRVRRHERVHRHHRLCRHRRLRPQRPRPRRPASTTAGPRMPQVEAQRPAAPRPQ
jgi:hypothetical protein